MVLTTYIRNYFVITTNIYVYILRIYTTPNKYIYEYRLSLYSKRQKKKNLKKFLKKNKFMW